jgi:WD40 repeat protein
VNKIHSKVGWESKGHDWQRPPPISLILENIYGVLLSDKRHTIMYMHFSNRQDKEKIDKARQKKLGLT